MRLELENKKLRAASGNEKQSVELEDKLDNLNRLNTKYVQDMEGMKKIIKEYESGEKTGASIQEFEELKASYQKVFAQNEKYMDSIKQLEAQNKRHLEEINNLLKDTKKTSEDKQLMSDLTLKLRAAAEKIAVLSTEKSKLEGYLRTAKTMIREERSKTKDLPDQVSQKLQKQFEESIQLFKNQIKEKEKELASQKTLLEESKESSAREQRLMSSALYEMGLELQRLKAPKPDIQMNVNTTVSSGGQPITSPNEPKSLLAQKRREMDKR